MPTYRQIKIEGKLMRCRALNVGELRRPGDAFGHDNVIFRGSMFEDMPQKKVGNGVDQVYRPVSRRRKPKAAVKGPKAVKAWAIVKRDGTFTLQDVCSTRERAYFEVGAWNHPNLDIKDGDRKLVIPVRITPLRPAAMKGNGK